MIKNVWNLFEEKVIEEVFWSKRKSQLQVEEEQAPNQQNIGHFDKTPGTSAPPPWHGNISPAESIEWAETDNKNAIVE